MSPAYQHVCLPKHRLSALWIHINKLLLLSHTAGATEQDEARLDEEVRIAAERTASVATKMDIEGDDADEADTTADEAVVDEEAECDLPFPSCEKCNVEKSVVGCHFWSATRLGGRRVVS